MKSFDIRRKFLQFFQSEGHKIVPSSSLIPISDPSLLFTNSGMVQFKNIFTGKEEPLHKKVVSLQRCIRAGGKHNDLENVGYTTRHHTFFEMLGNFSFGDYFKYDAIYYAWKLLTDIYKLPSEKLLISVYKDDAESYEIWNSKIGVPSNQIIRVGDKKNSQYDSDNFWKMSETGPCGPCSEIFYDYGLNFRKRISDSLENRNDRYIEIWNLVFMQFDCHISGKMIPIPTPCVDTGMGLERLAAVLQGVHSNYDTDLFKSLILASSRETNINDLSNNSLKVIADHIRSSSFLISDGIIPSNEGRGYVLRRIIRRAFRHGYKLGQIKPFFHKLVPDLISEMRGSFPELDNKDSYIIQTIKQEEERFEETLGKGMKILKNSLDSMNVGDKLDGKTIFSLYDTYGFPVDLTTDICHEYKIDVNMEEFQLSMTKQRNLARSSNMRSQYFERVNYRGKKTYFVGYEKLQINKVKIVAILLNGESINQASVGQQVVIVLDKTPFYAESGGQIGDIGSLEENNLTRFLVSDTQEIQPGIFGHYGLVESGTIFPGKFLSAHVDIEHRKSIQRNHSATHLLHETLYQILGNHIKQHGSLIDSEKIRFDFNQAIPMTVEQILKIENMVNSQILDNKLTKIISMTYTEAIKHRAVALFTEKYKDIVRVVDIGFSKELCVGTHVKRTGDIGSFKIISQESIGSGIRRIQAVTGKNVLSWMQSQNSLLFSIANILHDKPENAGSRILQIQKTSKDLEKKISETYEKLALSISKELEIKIKPYDIKGINLLIESVSNIDKKLLRRVSEHLRDRLKISIILLTSFSQGRLQLVLSVTNDIKNYIKADEMMVFLTKKINGKGGGNSTIAMGISVINGISSDIISILHKWIENKLQNR
ncbi:MAG: alanine--tRNA ligase [Bordetella sp.]|nr:MAG: alanine--tRNA ligase [Bordetella sp.]